MKIKSVKNKLKTKEKKANLLTATKRLQAASDADLIFETLNAFWPNAKCELEHNNAFQLLLAVVLSAQTTDKAVNKALAPLFQSHPDFSAFDLVELGEKNFLKTIKSIGLAPTKAKNSLLLAKKLIAEHGGEVPLERAPLEELPGVGRKTANVVLNVLKGLPTMAVDTHVARVSVRMGLARPSENRLQIESDILQILPSKWGVKAHHLLIFHGRYHCTARNPRCTECPVRDFCRQIGIKKTT